MANKHKTTKPRGELIHNAQEILRVERYWHLADRPVPRIPPKDYHYVKELFHLQFELIKLQEWVRLHGLRICVLFEGRDAAGKGGVIKRITQSLNPRICRVVALGTPTEKERGQWYFQRYAAELPSARALMFHVQKLTLLVLVTRRMVA
jgi:polyphosphate kinase 2 (PPK2 family)